MISKKKKTHLSILHQSRSPFDAHCASASDQLVDAAFGCTPVSVARSVAAEAVEASWNCVINFGLARSTRASIVRRLRLAPRTKVIGRLSSSSPLSNMALYSSSALADGGNSLLSPGAGFRRSCKVGVASTTVDG